MNMKNPYMVKNGRHYQRRDWMIPLLRKGADQRALSLSGAPFPVLHWRSSTPTRGQWAPLPTVAGGWAPCSTEVRVLSPGRAVMVPTPNAHLLQHCCLADEESSILYLHLCFPQVFLYVEACLLSSSSLRYSMKSQEGLRSAYPDWLWLVGYF